MNDPRDAEWAEARKRCRLSADAVAMAKELGLKPQSLSQNIPSPGQKWKMPVEDWVRNMYRKRFGDRKPPPARELPAPGPKPGGKVLSPEAARDEPSVEPASTPPRNLLREAEERLLREGEEGLIDPEVFSDRMRQIENETPVSEGEIEQENSAMLKRHQSFRQVADQLAHALGNLPIVQRVVLFGAVAAPLQKEVPRFRRLRRANVKIWHECHNVDVAVWLTDLGQLRALKKVISGVTNIWNLQVLNLPGVAHHQIAVFLFEPGTDRYRGNLCHYGTCPKGKPECEVAGCGAQPFLQLYKDFNFDRFALLGAPAVVLFDRGQPPTPGAGGLDRG